MQKEDENIEDFIKIFAYNVKRVEMHEVDEETLKALLLKSIRDEWIDILNFMGKGYISNLSFGDICELYIQNSRGKERNGKNPRDPPMSRINKSVVGTVSRVELGNFLENFKTDILGSLIEKIDTLKVKNKKNVENVALSIFYSKCREKHAIREFPLILKV